MNSSPTDVLCTRCGLCCDGSLLADVELASRSEATRLEILGLEIEDDDAHGLLPQPCRALRGTLCSIYPHRPECCRTFECRLLQDVRRGEVTAERGLQQIASARDLIERARELMAALGRHDTRLPLRESCAEVLARDGGADPVVQRKRAELEAVMADLEAMIRRTFLADAGPAAG
jgi:Fe-S-cluster containining protein